MQYSYRSIQMPPLACKSWGQDLPFRLISLSVRPHPSFSNNCCNILTFYLFFFLLFFFLSLLWECESPIKSHLKAFLPSPCASCVLCYLSINSTAVRGTAATSPSTPFPTPRSMDAAFGVFSSRPHPWCVLFLQGIFIWMCMCAWINIFYLHVGGGKWFILSAYRHIVHEHQRWGWWGFHATLEILQ